MFSNSVVSVGNLYNFKQDDKCRIYWEIKTEYLWTGQTVRYFDWVDGKILKVTEHYYEVCRFDPEIGYRHEVIRIVREDGLLRPLN